MLLTAGQIYDATVTLTRMMNRSVAVPQMAKFKLARMHDALNKVYSVIEEQRIMAVQHHGEEIFADEAKTISKGWSVGEEGTPRFKAYMEAWDAIRAQNHDVNITPITLQSLGEMENGPEAADYKFLGPLVIDATEPQEKVGNA